MYLPDEQRRRHALTAALGFKLQQCVDPDKPVTPDSLLALIALLIREGEIDPEEILTAYFPSSGAVLEYQKVLTEHLDAKYQNLDKNILKEDYKLEMRKKQH